MVEGGRQLLVHRDRVVAAHEVRGVAVASHQGGELVLGDTGQHGGVGDLVPVEVQDRQHGTVGDRVEELVRMPAGRERTGFGLPVADHAQHQQVRVVERRAEGVHQRVAELAAFMDGPGSLGRDVARDAAGKGELTEQPPHPVLVGADRGIDLAVGALQVRVGHQARATMTRSGHVQHVQVPLLDHPVHVGVQEVEPRCGAPVTEQPRLDVLGSQRLPQQRVVQQIDLTDRQVVCRPPVRVDQFEILLVNGGGFGDVETHEVLPSKIGRLGAAAEIRGSQDTMPSNAKTRTSCNSPATT